MSFDINHHPYTPVAVEYFRQTYPDRFTFVQGDSMKTVPEYSKKFPDQKFDLIYIDGGHSYELCLNDIINCKKLAHPNTSVWVDDYHGLTIQQAVAALERQGLIKIKNVNRTSDKQYGDRCWASSPIPLQNSTDHKKTTDRDRPSVAFIEQCKSALHHVHAAHSSHTAHPHSSHAIHRRAWVFRFRFRFIGDHGCNGD